MRRDYGVQISDTLVQLASVLDGLDPDQWAAQSLCDRWSVRDVVGHLVWRVGGSYGDMLRTAWPLLTLSRANPGAITDAVSRQEAEASSPQELVRRLRRIAAFRLAGLGRTGTGDLIETVVHTYDIVQPLGARIEVDADATRRVALGGLMLASAERRAVVAQHTLFASDAGWAIGRGSIIDATAQGIVLFLHGRHPLRAVDETGANAD
ncbi:maleylpyruvate isomerase family mycothiol-dependent enzyme [Humibacter albus]|uniref:maleylpyruvate isomerase family mycothiol-dependent enzyme n=1 Tax=Humibacter albus TaxID=427754 RepID=UPI0003B6B42A|nr:maleylpyruvate isomerase family mycothiol-dependent enzyme [Humibacter albus]